MLGILDSATSSTQRVRDTGTIQVARCLQKRSITNLARGREPAAYMSGIEAIMLAFLA
jgi:hypothetical protein